MYKTIKNKKIYLISIFISFSLVLSFSINNTLGKGAIKAQNYSTSDEIFNLTTHTIIIGYTEGNFWHCWPCDIDEDGDIDVIGSSSRGEYDGGVGFLSWSENNGDGSSWTTRFVDDDQCGPVWAETADMDDDGDIDVLCAVRTVSGVCSADHILFYENDGSESFTRHYVKQGGYGASYVVHIADFDDDGDLDCCGISPYDDRADWFENTGDPDSWTQHTVDADSGKGHRGLAIGDIDDDGYTDIIIGEGEGAQDLFWCENDGSGGGWSQTVIDSSMDAPNTITTGDIDGDDDIDVLSGSYNDNGGCAWFENKNDGSSWTKHVIVSSGGGFRGCNITDIDDDGDMDLLVTYLSDDEVIWYENDGEQSFTEHIISDSVDAACSVYPADLNGDGDLDVIAASDKSTPQGGIFWWAQNTSESEENEPVIQFLFINSGGNNSDIYTSTPTINWTIDENASQYHLEIDNNADFSSPEVNYTDINQWNYPSNCNINATRVSFTLPSPISSYGKYYMRVRPYT